jgi:hypothetical protein
MNGPIYQVRVHGNYTEVHETVPASVYEIYTH